jgi:S-adenosylmethionine hydrolase
VSIDPLITLTTDFGYEDAFVGAMKGVILSITPASRIVDLTHGIRPYDIKEAAFNVGTNYKYFPEGTVHVVVVDPGVGSGRRPVIVSASGHYFVGPDNGVFSYVYRHAGKELLVVHITAERFFLSSSSPTFQGRDVFAPVAARLAGGIDISEFGDRIDDFVSFELPLPERVGERKMRGQVVHVDRFGNAITNVTGADLRKLKGEGALEIRLREKKISLKTYYAEGDDRTLSALVSSSGYLEFFISRGNAARKFAISEGDEVEIIRV